MQVEHHTKDFPVHNEGFEDFKSEFGPLQDFDQEKMEEELANPEVKEVHVFKKGGLAEINAQLRHEEPHLTRRQRRKKAAQILRQRGT